MEKRIPAFLSLVLMLSVNAPAVGAEMTVLVAKSPNLSGSFANEVIDDINQALANSGISTRFSNAYPGGTFPSLCQGGGLDVTTSMLNCAEADLSDWRDNYAADLVVLVVELDPGQRTTCGRAFGVQVYNPLYSISVSNDDAAFAVVGQPCLANEVAPHEVGHMLYLEHNRSSAYDPFPGAPVSGNHGWIASASGVPSTFWTVMATPIGPQTWNYFSNPLTHVWYAPSLVMGSFGDAEAKFVVEQDSWNTVAQYREPGSGGPPTCIVGPVTCYDTFRQCLPGGNLLYRVNWGAADANWYTAVRSNGNQVFYSGPGLSQDLVVQPGNPEWVDVYADSSYCLPNPVPCSTFIPANETCSSNPCAVDNPASVSLSLSGIRTEQVTGCELQLSRPELIAGEDTAFIREEWAVFRHAWGEWLPVNASLQGFADRKWNCLQNETLAIDVATSPEDEAILLIDHALHPPNHRFMPHPVVRFAEAKIDAASSAQGFFRIDLSASGEVRDSELLYADQATPESLLQSLEDALTVDYADQRRHRVVIYGVFNVQDDVLRVTNSVPTLPRCCPDPEPPCPGGLPNCSIR